MFCPPDPRFFEGSRPHGAAFGAGFRFDRDVVLSDLAIDEGPSGVDHIETEINIACGALSNNAAVFVFRYTGALNAGSRSQVHQAGRR